MAEPTFSLRPISNLNTISIAPTTSSGGQPVPIKLLEQSYQNILHIATALVDNIEETEMIRDNVKVLQDSLKRTEEQLAKTSKPLPTPSGSGNSETEVIMQQRVGKIPRKQPKSQQSTVASIGTVGLQSAYPTRAQAHRIAAVVVPLPDDVLNRVNFPVYSSYIPTSDSSERPLNWDKSDDETSIMLASLNLTTQLNLNECESKLECSNLIRVPISIQETGKGTIRFKGILDTAAQLPVLSKKFCDFHGILTVPVENQNLRPTYFDARGRLPSWQTLPLVVRYMGHQPIQCVFLVLNSESMDCLIGGKLRESLGLHDDRNIATEYAPDDEFTPTTTSSVSVFNIGIVNGPSSGIDTLPSDESMIHQNWTDLPSTKAHDLPVSFSGSAPTRQHVVDHELSDRDKALVAPYLPILWAAIANNNAVTLPAEGKESNFIDHPDAVVQLLHVEGTKPKYIPQGVRQPDRKQDAIRAQIQKWKANGKVRFLDDDEKHDWNSRLITAPKPNSYNKDGTQKLRICFDASRTVNPGLICDPRDTPPVQEVLARCRGATWFTELDCEDAYLQLRLDKESQRKTAFEFEGEAYCFVGVPYGLTFIGNTFHNCLRSIFRDLKFLLNYIDNLWVITPDDNVRLHFEQVMATIARCNLNNIRLGFNKPVFFKRKFVGLGHMISFFGIELDPHKVLSALSWQIEALRTVCQLKSFLGSTNYLRNNIRHYSELVTPLYAAATEADKMSKGKRKTDALPIHWTEPLRHSLQIFKQAIGTAPRINFAEVSLPFAVATDASRGGVGSTLFQPRTAGELPNVNNIVSFNSRSLHQSERGYSAYKLEFLSIIVAIRRYHDFIWGTHFLIYTDHQALMHIWTQPEFNNTYAGWIAELYDYSFDIFHIPGNVNVLPDTLSRLYAGQRWGIQVHADTPQRMPFLPRRTLTLLDSEEENLSDTLSPIVEVPTLTVSDQDLVGTRTPRPVNSSSSSTSSPEHLGVNINVTRIAGASQQRTTRQPSRGPVGAQTVVGPTVVETRDRTTNSSVTDEHLSNHTTNHQNMTEASNTTQSANTTHGTQRAPARREPNPNQDPPSDDEKTGNTPSSESKPIPSATAEQLEFLQDIHAKTGHFGVTGTYRHARSLKSWPHMIHHVKQVVASCEVCQRWSIVKRSYNPIRSPQAWWPFDIMQYDLACNSLPVTERGSSVLLALIDVLTGFCFLRAIKDKKSSTIAHTLLSVFCEFGTPRILRSDNDATMVSEVTTALNTFLGIHLETSIPYHPSSLGKAERVIGTALTCIHKGLTASALQWDVLLPVTQLNINLKTKELTGIDPFTLMFNRPCNMFHLQDDPSATDPDLRVKASRCADLSTAEWVAHCKKLEEILFPAVRERIAQRQDQIAERFKHNHMISNREIPVGTMVAIKDVKRLSKNEPPMLAPYTIHEKCSNGGYLVRDKAGGILPRAVPIDHIRPLYHATRPNKGAEDGSEYYADFIVSHRKVASGDEYLIKWVGTDEMDWTPASNIADYNLIHDYLSSLDRLPKTTAPKRNRIRAAFEEQTNVSQLDSNLNLPSTESRVSKAIRPLLKLSRTQKYKTKEPVANTTSSLTDESDSKELSSNQVASDSSQLSAPEQRVNKKHETKQAAKAAVSAAQPAVSQASTRPIFSSKGRSLKKSSRN